ncbi:MAG: ABC transporter ATP-binding protein [Sphingobacteriales bacterium]|nr:ABC transporter ATP-binding protein [Sphingobacteriales bacterium]MBI3720655.1 ABC transporter ATP-binding protein [Sphingobacteriales bacterium]
MKKYSRVFGYLKQYRGKIFLYFTFILLSTVFSIFSISMLMPFFNLIFLGKSDMLEQAGKQGNDSLQWLTNFIQNLAQQFNDNKFSLLLIICAFILTSIFLKNLFLYLSYYVLNPLKNTVVTKLRQEVYDKILRLPIGFFTEKRKGDIMSRMTTDIGEIETSVVGTLEGWIRDPLQILFCIIYLFYLSVQLTLFMLLLLPIMGFVIGRIGRSLKKQSKVIAELSGESVSILDETLTGLRVIKAFTAEKLLGGRFISNNNKLLQTRNAIGYRRDLASPLSETMGILVFCFILLYGGSLILNHSSGSLSGGTFIVYLGMFYNIINPAKTLSTSFYNMQKGSAAIIRIEEVLKAPVTVDDNPNGIKKESFDNSIELKNVGFNYEDVSILKNINLKIEKGKTIALVGSSGAGKSTLVDLIPRFHDVSSGELSIDGKNIKEYSLKHLRNLMGIVTQEPILFNDTIANNIALGKPDATKEEIETAAKIANAYNFIIQKEEGFDTNIGDRGSKLSGGERQRLTIARAVLKNPPILILDEATSSLDTESERLVQDAINHLMQDRTSVVIAHRLSTVRHADEIIVLQKGGIVERGTHDELVAKNGFYKRLVEMQEVK